MPAFPRTWLPAQADFPHVFSGPLVSRSQSGAGQVRATTAAGRTWQETWPPLDTRDATVLAFLADVEAYYRLGTVLTVDHRNKRTLLGLGPNSTTPTVGNGSGGGTLLGASISTYNWNRNNALVLKKGDIIRFNDAAFPLVYEVAADATTDGSGKVAISIDPPIFVGQVLVSGTTTIITNATAGSVTFNALIASFQPGTVGSNRFLTGMAVTFAEML